MKIWGQYGRHVCLRIDGIPLKNNEARHDVLDSIKDLFELAKVNIPGIVVDRAYRIGCIYKDCASNKNCKGIIVRFRTFRYRTILYRAKSKLKQNLGMIF